jgi:predicted Fe-Mo cluster-binding NifX family protein
MIESHPRVEKVERCLSRTAGGRFTVDLDVVLRTHSHELADRISSSLEHEVRREFPRVVMARIRARSHQSDEIRRLIPVETPGGFRAPHLARAPWFLLEKIDRTSNKTMAQEYVENPHWNAERKRGFLVGQWLLKFKPDQVVVPEKKEGTAVALLREAGVEVVLAEDPPTETKQ